MFTRSCLISSITPYFIAFSLCFSTSVFAQSPKQTQTIAPPQMQPQLSSLECSNMVSKNNSSCLNTSQRASKSELQQRLDRQAAQKAKNENMGAVGAMILLSLLKN